MNPNAVFAAFAALTLFSACEQQPEAVARKNPVPGGTLSTCAGSSAPSCRFLNSPVKLEPTPVRLPKRPLPFYPTAQELDFVDAVERRWVAPKKTLTDGASIPEVFISVIGDPTSREFANAAAIHDAYCGVGNEKGPRFHSADWRSVHRMFYDALRVGGTPEVKAKVMYAAVYLGGPRWGVVRENGPASGASAAGAGAAGAGAAGVGAGGAGAARLAGTGAPSSLPPGQLRSILRQTIGLIETTNPPLPEIESFADGLVATAIGRGLGQGEGGGDGSGEAGYGDGNEGTDPVAGDPSTATATASDPAAGTGSGQF
ncbi:MAG: DUF1353 domain-containing protein [Paracoccaceae bacterium]